MLHWYERQFAADCPPDRRLEHRRPAATEAAAKLSATEGQRRLTQSPCLRPRSMVKAACTYPSTPTTGLFLELELRQLLERLFGAAGKCNLLPVIADIEAFVRDGDQMPAEAEEAANLQDGDEASPLGHDEI